MFWWQFLINKCRICFYFPGIYNARSKSRETHSHNTISRIPTVIETWHIVKAMKNVHFVFWLHKGRDHFVLQSDFFYMDIIWCKLSTVYQNNIFMITIHTNLYMCPSWLTTSSPNCFFNSKCTNIHKNDIIYLFLFQQKSK